MTYFVNRKLARVAATIAVRRDYVEDAQRATTENIYTLERIVSTALPLATAQMDSFADYLGEPMPGHLRAAITTEIELWRNLQESLADFRDAEPTEADTKTYAGYVRQYLAIQADLLRMTEELVSSCLIDHYITMTRALRAAAKEVPL